MPTKPFLLCRLCLLFLLVFLMHGTSTLTAVTQDDIDFRKETYVNKKGNRLLYRLYVPTVYDKDRKYPLLLWLHSGDGRGSDNVKQLTKENQLATHFWISKDVQASFPVFLFVPQCPLGENWSEPEFNQPGKALELTVEALGKIRTQYSIDPDRVYIGGQSMGGLGVWTLLQKYPGEWAAALVMSAYDNFSDVDAIVRVPVWVFQGDADDSVPTTMVRDMMHQLKKANANLRYTEYHKGNHEVWKRAYADPDLVPWLSAQHRGGGLKSQVGSGTSPPTR
jgi:predicted peptidase